MSSATVNVSKMHFDGFNFVINEVKKQVVTDMCREYNLDFDEVMRKLDGEYVVVPNKGNKSGVKATAVEKQSPTDLTKKPRGRSPKGKKWLSGTGWVRIEDASSDEEHSDNDGSQTDKEAEKAAAKEANDAEKAAAKEAKDAEKAAAKEAKEAEKAAAKAAKEAEKAAAKEAKDAEKAAAKAAKEAEKADKVAAKATKDAEKAEKADDNSAENDLTKKPRGRSPKGKVWESGVGWIDIADTNEEANQVSPLPSEPSEPSEEPIVVGEPINVLHDEVVVEEHRVEEEVEEDEEEEEEDEEDEEEEEEEE